MLGKKIKIKNSYLSILLIGLLAGLAYNAYFLSNKYHINGDARQHIFWTYKFSDPKLFENDLLVKFASSAKIAPPGYRAIYFMIAKTWDPLIFSKLLPILLTIISSYLIFELVRYNSTTNAAIVAVLLFCMFLPYKMVGGLQRSFALPLFLAFLCALLHNHFWVLSFILILQALFYPSILINSIGILPFAFFKDYHLDTCLIKKAFIPLIVGSIISFSLLAYIHIYYNLDFIGPMVSYKEARNMPEFWENGRNAFFHHNIIYFYLGKLGHYTRSGLGILEWPTFFLCIISLVFLSKLKLKTGKIFISPLVKWLFFGSLFIFILAHILLFHLYLPSKYTTYTLPLCVVILMAENLDFFLSQKRRKWVFSVTIIGFIIATLVSASISMRDEDKCRIALYKFLSTLPKDVLLAAHPILANDIPVFSKRSVLVNEELSLAYHKNYYKEIKKRLYDVFKLIYAKDMKEAISIIDTYGITHIVLSTQNFNPKYLNKERLYWEPFNSFLKNLTREKTFLFANKNPSWIIFQNRDYWVVNSRAILRAPCYSKIQNHRGRRLNQGQ